MVQHLLLMLGAAPLVALGAPLTPILWSAPLAARRPIAAIARVSFMRSVTLALALHSLALWAWHIPGLYELALQNRAMHIFEHASYLGTAMIFWWAILHAGRAAYGLGVLSVFGLALQSTILGALLTFAPRAWYSMHEAGVSAWGMTPLEDQQIAGLIMWVPGGSIYLACALGLFAAWLKESDRRPDQAAHTPARR
jgi:putative membrane protein